MQDLLVYLRRGLLPVVALLVATQLASSPRAASRIDGLWEATVVASGAEIPFRFEIATNGTDAQGFFFEGDQKVGSTSGRFANDVLTLDYDFLNTTLTLTLEGDLLHGTYTNKRANAKPQDVRAHRFSPVPVRSTDPPALPGNWEMRRRA